MSDGFRLLSKYSFKFSKYALPISIAEVSVVVNLFYKKKLK